GDLPRHTAARRLDGLHPAPARLRCWRRSARLPLGAPREGRWGVTAEEWDACQDPGAMLEAVRGQSNDRRLRLFAVAGCRRVMAFRALDQDALLAVDFAEAHADDGARAEDLAAARLELVEPLDEYTDTAQSLRRAVSCATAVPLGDVLEAS